MINRTFPNYWGRVLTVAPGALVIGALTIISMFACSCGNSDSTQTITETRSVSESAAPAATGMSTAQQLGVAANAASATPYEWVAPEGWETAPPTSTRLANFRIGTDAECYLTILPGGAGGAEANVNRWRKQMSLADYTAEEFAVLTKKSVLGTEALFVAFDGTYVGMGGSESKDGYSLLGVIFDDSGKSVFVKMVGPKAVVDAERERFDSFCQSLKRAETTDTDSRFPEGHPDLGSFAIEDKAALPAGHPDTSGAAMPGDSQLPAGHPPIDSAGTPSGMSQPATLTWTAPDTWKPAPDRAMRIVTFLIGDGGKTECYVTSVSKAAGDAAANINLLRGQMGQQPLDAAAIEALPKVTVLGQPAPFMEISGSYSGMDGAKRDNYLMYGVVAPMNDRTVFVKLTGPEAEVKGERDRFVAFCESLKTP
ncbi:MAG: hypothetical protein WC655_01290 [Candidatus Hydrogenedentales bacterium]